MFLQIPLFLYALWVKYQLIMKKGSNAYIYISHPRTLYTQNAWKGNPDNCCSEESSKFPIKTSTYYSYTKFS